MNDYIIIANGNFLIRETIQEAIQKKIVIALDGASNKLLHLNIKPNIILGDFDSAFVGEKSNWGIKKSFHDLSDDEETYTGHHEVTIVPTKNQLYTDLVKAIHYCDLQPASSITIICATGGRMDHHEGAMRALRSYYQKNRPMILHTDQQSIRFAKDEIIEIHGISGDKCGFIAYPHGKMSSQGLEFEADNFPLEFAYSENICNSLISTVATVEISGEALIIMPSQLTSQREWMQKSEKEKLLLMLRDVE